MLLHRWHRRLGMFSALFVLWLALSGLVLHHSDGLGLDQLRIRAPWLTQWYGLNAEPPASGYSADGHWLAGNDEATVLDGTALSPPIPQPLGMVAAAGLLVVATPHTLVLLTPQGQRVDELKNGQLPVPDVHRLGSADGAIVIRDERDYVSPDGESWQAFAGTAQWSQSVTLTPAQRALAAPLLRPSLSALRVLSDAHSGRLFGRYGPLLIDASAIAFVLLAISGVWIYARRSRRAV